MVKNPRIFMLTISIIVACSKSFGQLDIDVKTNLFAIPSPNLSVEIGAGKASIELGGRYWTYSSGSSGSYVTDIEGNVLSGSASAGSGTAFSIHVMPTVYLKPAYSLDGFKFSPYLNYTKSDDTEFKSTRISAGGIIGYKGFFTPRIGWEFAAGYGKAFKHSSTNKATNQTGEYKDLKDLGILGKIFSNLANTDIPIQLKVMYRFGEGFPK